jgi:hypothetical protein
VLAGSDSLLKLEASVKAEAEMEAKIAVWLVFAVGVEWTTVLIN